MLNVKRFFPPRRMIRKYIEVCAPRAGDDQRRVSVRVNGADVLDVESHAAGFWCTRLDAATLVPQESKFYPVVMGVRDGTDLSLIHI